jgi:hypothetical protein
MKCTVLALLLWAIPALADIPVQVDAAWLPVSDAELRMKTPQVEKDAGVEALFWRVHVMDHVVNGSELQRYLIHYVRLKVFDEKGKSKVATIEIPYSERESVSFVTGRTIKADGTVLELKKENVFDRVQARVGGFRQKVVSFAMPGVEPGAIVEYRWRELRDDPGTLYIRLQFQLEYPVQKVTYFVRPLSGNYTAASMVVHPFNTNPLKWQHGGDGFDSTTVENVPAFRAEPMMPGEANVRPWALVFYTTDTKRDPNKYWSQVGRTTYNTYLKPAIKTSDELKAATAQAIAGAKSDEEKVTALIRYIRANVRGLYGNQVSDMERAKILKERPKERYRTSAEVFKSGIADSAEMNILLAAMASVAGLEARPALVADRQDVVFSPDLLDQYFLPNVDMAIQIGGQWKLFDASARLLPASMVSWREEGMQVLLSDSKNSSFIASPVSPPLASRVIRGGHFQLSGEGELEGDVDLIYTGHLAFLERVDGDRDTEARRLEKIKEQVNKVFPEAEVSNEKIENAADPEKALKVHYHLKLTNFAQRTGKRLLFQPLFFEIGASPLFSAGERQYDIVFPYAWDESDSVHIQLPDGFELDNPENPGSLNIGKAGAYVLKMSMEKRELICNRDFVFGDNGLLVYGKKQYQALKNVFDEVHRRDSHMVSLKQAGLASKPELVIKQ